MGACRFLVQRHLPLDCADDCGLASGAGRCGRHWRGLQRHALAGIATEGRWHGAASAHRCRDEQRLDFDGQEAGATEARPASGGGDHDEDGRRGTRHSRHGRGGDGPALALDEVTFGTNWLAQAEHGGFYQAVADGTYEKYGLKVTIRQGGPQAANRALLIAGQIQFYMGGNMLEPFDAVKQGIPTIDGRGDLPEGSADPAWRIPTRASRPSRTSPSCRPSSWRKDGFVTVLPVDEAGLPGLQATSSTSPTPSIPAPFIADKQSAQQGYLTSEPLRDRAARPASSRRSSCSPTTASTPTRRRSRRRSTMVAEASPTSSSASSMPRSSAGTTTSTATTTPPTTLIKADNPEMTDEQIAFSIEQDEGVRHRRFRRGARQGHRLHDATRSRSPSTTRWSRPASCTAGIDLAKAYTTQFVCKGVGMDLKK